MHVAIYHYEVFCGEAPATLTFGAYYLKAIKVIKISMNFYSFYGFITVILIKTVES